MLDSIKGESKMLPLVRLRVDYSNGFTSFPPTVFSRQYVHLVANPKDMIVFTRKSVRPPNTTARTRLEMPDEPLGAANVRELVSHLLETQNLTLLPENAFAHSVSQFVDKEESTSITKFIADILAHTQEGIVGQTSGIDVDAVDIGRQVGIIKQEMVEKFEKGPDDKAFAAVAPTKSRTTKAVRGKSAKNTVVDVDFSPSTSKTVSRTTRGATKVKQEPVTNVDDESSASDIEMLEETQAPTRSSAQLVTNADNFVDISDDQSSTTKKKTPRAPAPKKRQAKIAFESQNQDSTPPVFSSFSSGLAKKRARK